MYNTPGKRGATGGRGNGGAKRKQSPFKRPIASVTNRGSAPAPAHRNRSTTKMTVATPAEPSSTPEETYSLVHGDPLDFAMIIRLTPDLVDEIKRVGGNARIKFDSIANNASGNVIDVGGKDFNFTWSHERGDLCDIYEERRTGEDGGGVLVETGGAWRKLNVQRILDESTKNHVKMRSEEAERKLKSRKAIVLDPGNPSVKNHVKASAAAATETNIRRMSFPPKKEPAFKKRKVEPTQASVSYGGPPKSVYKSGLSSTITGKGRVSVSPLPSPREQLAASASPFKIGNLSKDMISTEEIDALQPQLRVEEKNANLEKGNRSGLLASTMDLQGMLITLLVDNPKGMSLKALEKAIGDTIPNSARKIGPIIKKIANFKAPGGYFLKPGVELGSMKKCSPESERYQDSARGTYIPDPLFEENVTTEKLEQQSQLSSKLDESIFGEQIVMRLNSPDPFGDAKKTSDHGEGRPCSSSDSGSDSDTDSESDSDSDSGSESKSSSESDGSSNNKRGSDISNKQDSNVSNKQGSDVDVDIMTSGDEKEVTQSKLQNIEPRIATSPITWRSSLEQPEQNGIDENKQDSEIVVAPNAYQDTVMTDSEPNKSNKREEKTMPFSVYNNLQTENEQVSYGGIGLVQSKGLGKVSKSKNKSKSKGSSDLINSIEKSDRAIRLKTGSLSQQQPSVRSKENFILDAKYPHKNPSLQRPRNHAENLGQGMLHFERDPLHEKISVNRESECEDGYGYENLLPKYFSEGSVGAKSFASDSNNRQQGEHGGKLKDARDMDSFSMYSGLPAEMSTKGKFLRREPSDLELGELRDPIHEEESPGVKKQFEKRNSFKMSERNSTSSNNMDDSTRPQEMVTQSRGHQFPRIDRVDSDVGFQLNNSADTRNKARKNGTRTSQELGLISDVDDSSKTNDSVVQRHGTKQGRKMGTNTIRETKSDKYSKRAGMNDRNNESIMRENSNSIQNLKESSSDEDNCSYSMYAKDEPELKGPIKDFSQYKEYVEEYCKKHPSYCSLNKSLQVYRDKFNKLGDELELAKSDRDTVRYVKLRKQLKENYRQCITKHISLKKIFVVLHKELECLKQRIQEYALHLTIN
ncbi:hypothetical protein GIB67_001591 [Kingdonia uniflora]|uniref:OCEL domain-containing protein n=1 Tax=Kingdonia uniflora TaxID=39325 RepID=A0A7J7L0U1_9MAGN|nr:hypothetical protein GIB67_001591 [Kingdonia uniflora]